METQKAYDKWSLQYDTNKNRTRDLEAHALRDVLDKLHFEKVLEIGCGTGKNTEYLVTRAKSITAVDLSEGMLSVAKQKIASDKVVFQQADISQPSVFSEGKHDLVTFSLVLEHIEELSFIFQNASKVVETAGHLYVGELHPFKQYVGTKARFETEDGTQVVSCFNHNITDFTDAAKASGFELVELNEYFDEGDRSTIPRILVLLFRKN